MDDLDRRPLLPDVGVIALLPDLWCDRWQSRHQILMRLAKYFHVVWVNPAHGWRECWQSRPPSVVTARPGLEIYTPEWWLPKFYRPDWLWKATLRTRLARAGSRLLARGCRQVVTYLWRPEFTSALDAVAHDLSCYHIDDEYSFVSAEVQLDPAEVRLIERVGQVFIHSRGLWARKGNINPHSALVPNGVDYKAFATPVPVPADLAPIPRPRIGYAGWIKKQMDWPLLQALATSHPQWSFVFVGGMLRHPEIVPIVAALSRLPNVYFLGEKCSEAMTSYPQHVDVCLLPYAMNVYTDYIYPIKLHEYLASGRPIVGPPIRSLEEFTGVVTLVEGREGWSRALAEALGPEANSVTRVRERRAIAQRHDWNHLVLRIARLIAERLGHRDAARLADPATALPSL